MVQFGRTIQEALDGKFKSISDNFVSYQTLKEIIKRIEQLNGSAGEDERDDFATKPDGELATLLADENEMELSDRFFRILDDDLHRLSTAVGASLAGMTWADEIEATTSNDAKKQILIRAFNQLQLLFEYTQLNSEGIRKIAKKFDRRCVDKDSDKVNQRTYIEKVRASKLGDKTLIDKEYFAIVEEYAKLLGTDAPQVAIGELEEARAKLLTTTTMSRLMTFVTQTVSPLMPTPRASDKTGDGERDWLLYTGNFVYISTLLYFFCVGLGLMSSSFKVMSGAELNKIVKLTDNPFIGLMVGIFATVMVQSSSTSTSIAVAMVGSGVLPLNDAIPMIMGANIGTSVTSTIVALGHMDNGTELNRAFAAATVHDVFNLLTVLILFPLEATTGFLRAWVGWISGPLGGGGIGGKYTGPLKYITKPILDAIVKVDKSKLKKHAEGKAVSGSLMSKGIFSPTGALSGMSDGTAGFIIFVISVVLVCIMLVLLVKFLRYLVGAAAKSTIRTAFGQGALMNIFIGMLITVSVQSSSITTSTLVPLAACGLITLEQMFPIVLGANIGTTCTALLAALAVDKVEGLELALCHLSFNLLGIMLLYPYEPIRNITLSAARGLGNEVQLRWWVAPAYLMTVFVVVPGICLLLTTAGSVALGVGGFFLFGLIAISIMFRYLFLNPDVTLLGMDHAFVAKLTGYSAEGTGIEMEMASEVPLDVPGSPVSQPRDLEASVPLSPKNYRPDNLDSLILAH